MDWRDSLNRFLDTLPQPTVGQWGQPVPMFRTCGVAGFYVALLVLLGGGLVTGRSLPVLTALAAVSGVSFFVYTYLHMWVTGREELVLLEHVWFALACNAVALWAMGQPMLAYLDLVSVALCPFLAAGRIGCTLVGCCHGRPSRIGITYTEACAGDGFSKHLVGIRLFPVQTIEALGLLAIGLTAGLALPLAAPGRAFAWYLLAYAVMRFGLEGLRFDRRPHWLGLSQARWMSIAEVAVAVSISADGINPAVALAAALLMAGFIIALAVRWKRDPDRLMLQPVHTRALRSLIDEAVRQARESATAKPVRVATAHGVSAAVSISRSPADSALHLSLSLPRKRSDLYALCRLAVEVVPEVRAEDARFTESRVFHVAAALPLVEVEDDAQARIKPAAALYGTLVRRLQRELPLATVDALPLTPPVAAPADPLAPRLPRPRTADASTARWYFGTATQPPQP